MQTYTRKFTFILPTGTSFPLRNLFFSCQLSFHLCFRGTLFICHRRCCCLDSDSIAKYTATNAAFLSCFSCSSALNCVSESSQKCWEVPCKLSGSPGSRPPSFQPAAVFVDRCNQTLSWRVISIGLWPQTVLFNNVTPAGPVAGLFYRLSLCIRRCNNVETATDRFN